MSDMFRSWLALSPEISIRWGLTLLHFLWQGALIGLMAFVLARLLRHRAAAVRYWLHAAALLACPLSVALTLALVEIPKEYRFSSLSVAPAIVNPAALPLNGDLALVHVPYPELLPEKSASLGLAAVVPAAGGAETLNHAPSITGATAFSVRTSRWLPALAQWITVLYSAGVFCFFVRLGVALWGGQRLRAISKPLTDFVFLDLVRDQANRIGLRIVPVVAYCERVAVPTVIGILRPMILLPATLTTGISPDELSAILSHELAHIRRYDLWMNLLQRVIESLLFFHPVVWFLSHSLSAEREICCDDLVVRSGHQPLNYASALLRMAELCATSIQTNVSALAASGDQPSLFEHRIHRLINARKTPRLQLTRAGFLVLMLTLGLSLAIPNAVRNWAQADEPPKSVAKKAEETKPADLPDTQEKNVDRTATISGSIVMEDGSPATMKGWMSYTSRNKNGTSNVGDGQYTDRFSVKCTTGTVWLIYFPDGFAPAWAGPFELEPGGVLADVKLVLKQGTSKLVRITNEDAEPIAGATLVTHPVIGGSPHGTVYERTTNENGEFLLEHLAETEYTLRCSAPGYQTLRSGPLEIDGDGLLRQTLKRSEITSGMVVNADSTPAVGATLLACVEVFQGGSANSMPGSGGDYWGRRFATTDSEGRFSMNQLSSGSHYLFVVETADHARAIVHNIVAGQQNLKFTIPQRLDLRVKVSGDISKLPQRNGKAFVTVRQHVDLRPDQRSLYGGFIGADALMEVSETGGTAMFSGLAVDLHPTPGKQFVDVSLGSSGELKKTVEVNLSGDTEVEFKLPGDQPDAAIGETASVDDDEVSVKYPYCVLSIDDLHARPLADAIVAFNKEAQESPTGIWQAPVIEQETRDAIAKFAAETHVPEAVRVQLNEILKSGTLPSNVYFRRFTRFDNGKQMQAVWWVRLVIETQGGPVYSVPVRTTPHHARPYTQMERQQNAEDGLTLINRFASYFEEPPNILLLKEFPKAAVDRLAGQAEAAINAKDVRLFESLFEWKETSDSTRQFVASEFQMLVDSEVHSIKVAPRNFRGHLIHWSAYQHYQPNLEIVGYLDIEYSKADGDADDRKTLSLEMGESGDELRLANYVAQGERNFPKVLVKGLSVRGYIEPLADGTYLMTNVITNPGTLLSAHLANEEVRLRDFSRDAAESSEGLQR